MNQVKKIYIVEDESIVALDISNQLKTIGYKVVGISSHSQDCLIQIQQKQPDLILMDVRLNGQFSGANVASEIYETLKIPIVFLTSYSDKQTLNEIQQIGNYGYVKKPFNILELKTEIEFTHNRFNKHLALKEESERSKITLKEKEEFFEQIVNNVSDIIYQIDLKGNFTYLNSSALSQTNFSKEELIGKHYSLLVRLDYKDKVYHFFRSIYEQKTEKVYMEFPIITKNRVEIWLGQNVHLLKKESQIIGFQVVARDITQEKEFKEQLIMAKMHAEHTARIKSQFLANMSHEIRTPLYGIVGVVTLLEKTNLSEKQTKYIQAINASSNQLMGIINDVLDLSKIDAGKMDIVDADIELYELIQSVISVFELKSENQHVSLTYTIDSTVPHFVVGDAVRLNQVLYNLIGNAIKFTEKGIVHVDISLLEETHEKHLIQFTVTDSGVGMAPEDCDKIFDAFTQIESESSLNKQGTGLGLTIVKKLIEMLNGSISVESILNEGSSFIIRLPFKRAYATNYTTKEYAIQYEKPTNVCILLVEDNPINQLVTKDLLENEGAVVSLSLIHI
jgi:PAS domain S-box-containing protein